MRGIGAIVLAVVVGVILLWVALQILVGAIKLLGVLIAIGLAVAVYIFAEKAIGKGR